MSRDPDVVAAAGDLRAALEAAAAALATADLGGVLQAELPLRLALERLAERGTAPAGDRAALRAEIDRARRALQRCRQLGGVLQDVVRLGLEAQGRVPVYGPREAGVPVYGPARVSARG
jgi:uncharacterized protein with von Willebrand factor type A (vWA) domain